MKKLLIVLMLGVMLIGLTAGVNENSGKFWITKNACGEQIQEENKFSPGEEVYLNGENLDSSVEYYWAVTGGGGSSSGDPGVTLADGFHTPDSEGKFCFKGYVVEIDDWGEYRTSYGVKNSNYRVNGDTIVVPEFSEIVGVLTVISALGVFFFVRRK